MIIFALACLAVLPHVRGAPGNGTATNASEPAPDKATQSGKIYSEIIKITEKDNSKKYDTISYSQQTPMDSKASQTVYPDSKIYILENGKMYEVGHRLIQAPDAQLQAAIGAVSAHLINHAHQEYIPYPPNGNPRDYPAYKEEYTESPLAGAYERANRAGYGFYHSHPDHLNKYPEHQNQQPCYHGYYLGNGEMGEFEERSFRGRGRKEPIKRQAFTASYG